MADFSFNEDERRYELHVEGELVGYLDVRLVDGVVDAVAEGGKGVIATCPFAAAWLERHGRAS